MWKDCTRVLELKAFSRFQSRAGLHLGTPENDETSVGIYELQSILPNELVEHHMENESLQKSQPLVAKRLENEMGTTVSFKVWD